MSIHPTAIIDPSAELGRDVTIGPYCVIGPKCKVGDGTRLLSHVVLQSHTTLGRNCEVSPGAVLGGLPQDYSFGGEDSWVEVGDNVRLRECVTLNRATGEGKVTRVGNDCMIMAYAHLAHNCVLGNNVSLANNVQLAGYVEIGDNVFIGGSCAAHQFVKVGRMTILGGFSGIRQDLPPFAMAFGIPADIKGINKIGLKRKGFGLEQRTRLKKAYHYLFFSGLNTPQAVQAIRQEMEADPLVDELVAFVENSKRGIRRPRKGSVDGDVMDDSLLPV